MAELMVLTDADKRLLQAMLDKQRRQPPIPPRQREGSLGDDSQSPEVYVALAPAGGVPAMVSDVPGAARCDVYQLLRTSPPSLALASPQVDVYSLSGRDVTAGTYALVVRDKYGAWVVASSSSVSTFTGTGTTSIDLTVRAADGSPSYAGVHTIEFDERDGFSLSNPSPGVVRVDIVDTGTGTSPVFDLTVQAVDGTPSYSGVSVLEFDEADGFSVSNPAPGRVRVDWVDPDVPPTCADITFQEADLFCEDGDLRLYRRTVTLNIVDGCLVKTLGSWMYVKTVACCDSSCAGTGTGTSTDSSCAGSPICCTLASALCSPLNGDFLLTFDGVGFWRYTFVPGAPFNIVASNVSGVWSIAVTCNYTSGSASGVAETCNPTFSVTFPAFDINNNSCCSDIFATVSAVLRPGSYCTGQTGTGTSEASYWWCLSPSGDTGTGTFGGDTGTGTGLDNAGCYYLTTAAKNSLLSSGWVLHAGPYTDRASCLIACSLSPDTGTGTSTPDTGTGTSGSVTTDCCPLGINKTLHLTVVSGCPDATASVPLVWDGSSWASATEVVNGKDFGWSLTCESGLMVVRQFCGGVVDVAAFSTYTCEPAFDSGDVLVPTANECCSPNTFVRITE